MLIVYSYLLGGFQIMGTPITKPEEYAALRLLFEREIIPDLLIPNDVNEVSYSCDTEALLEVMRIAFFDKETFEQNQLCFHYSHLDPTPSFEPCAYPIRRIDYELISGCPDFRLGLEGEILESYSSLNSFVNNGLGYAAVDGDKIIANLIANAVFSKTFVLGADTYEEYRKQGIASSLLLTAVRYAQANGFDLIWECVEDNLPSIKTAMKCGFRKTSSFAVRWFDLK